MAEVFGACAGGAVLTAWALYLGATPLVIGLLSALPLGAQVLHLPAAWLTQTVDRKRLAVIAIGGARLVWLPLVALPFVSAREGTRLAVFLGIVGLGAALAVIGNNAWSAWTADLVPEAIRGRFFGRRTVVLAAAGTATSLLAGLALDALTPRGWEGETLAALAGVGCLAAVVSIVLLRRQHDPAPPVEPGPRRGQGFSRVLRDPPARAYLWYQLGWNAAIAPAASFISFHMLANLRTGLTLAAAHGVGVAAVRIVAAPLWGRAVDRFGARPVLVVCSFGIATLPLAWLIAAPGRLWPIALDALIAGALWGGHGIAAFDLSVGLSPRRDRPFYLAAFATAAGVGFAASSVLSGLLAEMLPDRFHFLGLPWIDLHALFLLSALARAAVAGLALRIAEPNAHPIYDLLRAVAGSRLSAPGHLQGR